MLINTLALYSVNCTSNSICALRKYNRLATQIFGLIYGLCPMWLLTYAWLLQTVLQAPGFSDLVMTLLCLHKKIPTGFQIGFGQKF